MHTTCHYLNEDGTPNLKLLQDLFSRCGPTVAGGTEWLDNVRFCRWPGQHTDGRKHDRDDSPSGAVTPWNGASDVRPFVADDIINERTAMLTAAFWRSQANPGSTGDEAEAYAIALVEWLVFVKLVAALIDEVELSANYQEHYGWCVLAPRWRRELGLKHYTLKWETIAAGAQQAQQQLAQMAQQGQTGNPQPSTLNPQQLAQLQALAQLPALIADPTQEAAAMEFLKDYYDQYVERSVPEDLRDRVPKTTDKQARAIVRALREGKDAKTALPYICRNELEISALKPWDEVFLPNEMTTDTELMFQVERVSAETLEGRELAEGYDPEWVKLAKAKKGALSSMRLPTGTTQGIPGLIGGSTAVNVQTDGMNGEGTVELVHALFKGVDEHGVPAVYCTTFHGDITVDGSGASLYAKHELVESIGDGELPNIALVREKWSRGITGSRSVCEMVHTQQNMVKSIEDGMVDRADITLLPPVNVYENPLDVAYKFGPARKNFTRPGREPQFMQMPSGVGMADATVVHAMIRTGVDNRFALLSPDVPLPRQQTAQEKAVRRFLVGWTRAITQGLVLYQKHGDDAEFARVTGAEPGWLDAHRDVPGLLTAALEFDVRELDSELNMERIKTFNTVALPNDINGIYDRVQWAQDMARGILGPRAAKRLVRKASDASQALKDKATLEVLKMFAGNPATLLDDKDPTAKPLLDLTRQILMGNPNYLRALNDEALVTIAGPQQAQLLVQQFGQQRRPDELFSGLLIQWLTNLKFVGVTQVENRQIGRTGVAQPDNGENLES